MNLELGLCLTDAIWEYSLFLLQTNSLRGRYDEFCAIMLIFSMCKIVLLTTKNLDFEKQIYSKVIKKNSFSSFLKVATIIIYSICSTDT